MRNVKITRDAAAPAQKAIETRALPIAEPISLLRPEGMTFIPPPDPLDDSSIAQPVLPEPYGHTRNDDARLAKDPILSRNPAQSRSRKQFSTDDSMHAFATMPILQWHTKDVIELGVAYGVSMDHMKPSILDNNVTGELLASCEGPSDVYVTVKAEMCCYIECVRLYIAMKTVTEFQLDRPVSCNMGGQIISPCTHSYSFRCCKTQVTTLRTWHSGSNPVNSLSLQILFSSTTSMAACSWRWTSCWLPCL